MATNPIDPLFIAIYNNGVADTEAKYATLVEAAREVLAEHCMDDTEGCWNALSKALRELKG